MDDRLHTMWSIVAHLHSVLDSKELRKAYNTCLPKLSDYSTRMSHNKALYQAIVDIASSDAYPTIYAVKRRHHSK